MASWPSKAAPTELALRLKLVETPQPSSLRSSLRAYSSIGQSPRLITGLFQVRTLVGPRLFRDDLPRDLLADEGARAGVADGPVRADSVTRLGGGMLRRGVAVKSPGGKEEMHA